MNFDLAMPDYGARRRPLRLLAISSQASTTPWPLLLLRGLNRSTAELTHVYIADLEATACLPKPLLARLGASADVLLFELGRNSTAHYASIIALAERLLRATTSAMSRPSAALLLHCATPVASGLGPVQREHMALRSLTHPLSLFAQFYGLPTMLSCGDRGAPVGGITTASASSGIDDDDDELAAMSLRWLRSSRTAEARAGPRVAWRMPERQMLLDGSAEALDRPCVVKSDGLRCGVWRAGASAAATCPEWLANGGDGSRQDARDREGRIHHRDAQIRTGWPRQTSASAAPTAAAAGAARSPNMALGLCQRALSMPATTSTDEQQECARGSADQSAEAVAAALGGLRGSAQAGGAGGPAGGALLEAALQNAQMALETALQNAQTALETALSRTRAHVGHIADWARVLARLESGQEVAIGVLGGSMSLPSRSNHTPNWPEGLLGWMQRTWPAARLSLHNGAIGATGSAFFALCSENRLPERVDLIVLEHALNDAEHEPVVDAKSLRGRVLVYELLVRRLLHRSHRPALLFLSWDRLGWCANLERGHARQRILEGPWRGVPWLHSPQIAVDAVARWYDLPSLAPRNALWHRDCEDLRFRGTVCDSYGLYGCGHLKPLGTAVVTWILTSFLNESTARARSYLRRRRQQPRDLAAPSGWFPMLLRRRAPPPSVNELSAVGNALAAARLTSPNALPPPLVAAMAEPRLGSGHGAVVSTSAVVGGSGHGICLRGRTLLNLAWRVLNGSWSYVERDPGQPLTVDKPGLLSLVAPSVLELDVPPPPAGTIALGYLRSYDENMGNLRVGCVRGCSCNGTTLHGAHRQRSSILAMMMLPVHPPQDRASSWPAVDATACTLRLEHEPGTGRPKNYRHLQTLGDKKWGSKFKVLALVEPAVLLDPAEFKELEKGGTGW